MGEAVSGLIFPTWLEPLMRSMRPELRKKLSLRDIDEIVKGVRAIMSDELAAERARAERAEAAGVGYSQQTVDAITREREELRTDRDRLRAAIEWASAHNGEPGNMTRLRAALDAQP